MRSLSQSRWGSKVTNNLFLVILESAIVCVLFVCICVRLLIGLISAALGGGAQAHFPNSGWSSLDWVGTFDRCLWLLFMESGRGLLGEKLWLIFIAEWLMDVSKHNNHDRLYCGNLRFWPPCVEEDQAWGRDGQVFIGWDAVKVNNTIACIASVSSRGSSRKLGQEQKKKWMTGEGEGNEGFLFSPPPPPSTFFLLPL